MAAAPGRHNELETSYPYWFLAFLNDRAVRKPSPHTAKAYRQDFAAIATLMAGGQGSVATLTADVVTKEAMQAAFAAYAATHEAASIRRCWSTWNTLCAFLFTEGFIDANPMPLIGRPKVPKSLPKGLGSETIAKILTVLEADEASQRGSDWAERDKAIVLTAVLAGLRADELIGTNVGDIRTTDDGGVIQVRGKGNKDRRIPVEEALIDVVEDYLTSRTTRFPGHRHHARKAGLAAWPATTPLFVGADGERITRGTLQYRVLRAFKKAGLDTQRARGVLVHGFRHTFATELANADVSVYTLMKLLGHESMATSQRYVDGAGTQTRHAAAQNPLYGLIEPAARSGNAT